jgi:hypothetical protein
MKFLLLWVALVGAKTILTAQKHESCESACAKMWLKASTLGVPPSGQCTCGEPFAPSADLTFGTGHAGVTLPTTETVVFAHVIPPNSTGVMNHFWSTCSPEAETDMIVRYYVDNETTASIQFRPPLAAGVGFDDPTAPWGTKWFGLGAGNGGNGQAWFNNFKIPFLSSIRVTVQATVRPSNGWYLILRGGLNIPLVIGDLTLPSSAKLQLQVFDGPLKPLQVLDVASVPKGFAGQLFMTTLAVNNGGTGGLNFLEGCFHMFDPIDAPFPGTVLSTGTEDYYDSGWYFNAGPFHMPVSGLTHIKTEKNVTEWSAYRFHEMDPVRFRDGFRFTWRCGDLISADPTVGKCYTESGGTVVGSPTCDRVISYAWVYVWPQP